MSGRGTKICKIIFFVTIFSIITTFSSVHADIYMYIDENDSQIDKKLSHNKRPKEYCKFHNCTHIHEPGCAVKKGVKNHHIEVRRYQSYLNMLESIEEDIIF